VETGAQLISNGGDFSKLDASDIAVAAAVGAVTGGVGAVIAGELNGKSATASQFGAAVVGGTLGAGVGAKISTSFAKTLENGFGGLNSAISSTTRSGMVGDTVEVGTSGLQRIGEVTAEATSNLGQKAYNQIDEK